MIIFKELEVNEIKHFWDFQKRLILKNDFLSDLDKWARENGIIRMELTVEWQNESAKHLYEKRGFEIEGIRKKSMFVSETFVDEFYMAKIL